MSFFTACLVECLLLPHPINDGRTFYFMVTTAALTFKESFTFLCFKEKLDE